MTLAIIPARGGSKRIPRKNIRPFRGRPIIAYSIAAALDSRLFDTVMVSTDDEEIAEVARGLGAAVPFYRSAETSSDHATTADVLLEVLNEYRTRAEVFNLACCIYPTAPFVRSRDLEQGRALLDSDRRDVIMPVAAFDYPVWRSLKRDETGRITLNFPEYMNARSQDLPRAYHDAGQWYWFRVAALERNRTLLGGNSGSIVLPATLVQDIDTEDDWTIAELKHERVLG